MTRRTQAGGLSGLLIAAACLVATVFVFQGDAPGQSSLFIADAGVTLQSR
ncbi:MAG: hypothetical protein ABL308_07980 [Oceanicaulis sp.]